MGVEGGFVVPSVDTGIVSCAETWPEFGEEEPPRRC